MTHVTQNIVVYQVNTPTRGNQTHIFCVIGTDSSCGDVPYGRRVPESVSIWTVKLMVPGQIVPTFKKHK